ncbi:MAG: hypothetical protein ABI705_02985 [Aestuariivirga sp.]
MSKNSFGHAKSPEELNLTPEAAREICKKHGHLQAAEKLVGALPYRAGLSSVEVAELVQGQILHFEQGLVKNVGRARQVAGGVENLPKRAEQKAALCEIINALEHLRGSVERNWDLAGPLLEIETTEKLARLLTSEGTRKLLPADRRAEHFKASGNTADYIQQGLNRSFLFDAGSRPLTRLINGATTVVRRAKKKVSVGAPLKEPLEMALILQLAVHFEWALGQKASWAAGGPFSRFCEEVFEKLGLDAEYSWEYLMREGLKHHGTSFGMRRHHEPDDPVGVASRSHGRKSRKKQLKPLRGLKNQHPQ